jgi:hypothetical protein
MNRYEPTRMTAAEWGEKFGKHATAAAHWREIAKAEEARNDLLVVQMGELRTEMNLLRGQLWRRKLKRLAA